MRKEIRTKIAAIAAVTIDGKIALHRRHNSDWTSREDKKFLRSFLATCNVIVIGNNTYQTAKKPLAKRNCIVFTRAIAGTEKRGDNLLLCNPRGGGLRSLLRTYKKVGVLGGAAVYAYFLKNNLLDELYLTIEPIVFGKGISLYESRNALRARFRLLSVKRLNKIGSILLHYARV